MPKGYPTQDGYRGFVPLYHEWMLFSTEAEYLEYLRDLE